MTVRNIKTREGYEFWDKLCAIPRYGFIHSADNSRILKAEGIGNWIDMHAAQEVVDGAQDEINGLRAVNTELLDALEACRNELKFMIDTYNRRDMEDGSWTHDYQTVHEADVLIAKAKGTDHAD